MYKQLKSELANKKLLEELIRGKEERIRFKIQSQLGLHSTTFSELKVDCIGRHDDKFLRVYAQVEKLDKELQSLLGELKLIEKMLSNVDRLMQRLNEKDMNIFRNRFILGLSVRETAERLHYSEDYIKERTREILKK